MNIVLLQSKKEDMILKDGTEDGSGQKPRRAMSAAWPVSLPRTTQNVNKHSAKLCTALCAVVSQGTDFGAETQTATAHSPFESRKQTGFYGNIV